MVGQQKDRNYETGLFKAVKYIVVRADVGFRHITFLDKDRIEVDRFYLYTNMFPEHLQGKDLEIEEGNELVGFAVAADDCGNPGWLDFVVAGGGQWMYREFETCDKFHQLKTFKLIDSNDGLV